MHGSTLHVKALCGYSPPLSLLCMQVGFNIAGPALNQLANITEKREGGVRGVRKAFGVKKRAAAAGIAGLSAASLLAAPQADAATEAFQLAAGACMAREEHVAR